MVAEGKFRQDLYFRLRVGTIRLPPLRERGGEDLRLLSNHFLKHFAHKYAKKVERIGDDLHKAFRDYSWPGNVRELRNLIESMVVQDSDGVLTLSDVDDGEPLRKAVGMSPVTVAAGPDYFVGRPLSEIDLYYMQKTLDLTGGNREKAAEMLGIGERTLYRMIQDAKLQERIRQALAECDGDVGAAARKLNMDAASLERKLKKLGMRHVEIGDEEN
jgi:two-component system response regulator HydG